MATVRSGGIAMDLEKQKENFKNHVAKLTDYGNIKILTFSGEMYV